MSANSNNNNNKSLSISYCTSAKINENNTTKNRERKSEITTTIIYWSSQDDQRSIVPKLSIGASPYMSNDAHSNSLFDCDYSLEAQAKNLPPKAHFIIIVGRWSCLLDFNVLRMPSPHRWRRMEIIRNSRIVFFYCYFYSFLSPTMIARARVSVSLDIWIVFCFFLTYFCPLESLFLFNSKINLDDNCGVLRWFCFHVLCSHPDIERIFKSQWPII